MHEDNQDCCKKPTTTKNTINRYNIYYEAAYDRYAIIDCINSTDARAICTCNNKVDAATICKLLNF